MDEIVVSPRVAELERLAGAAMRIQMEASLHRMACPGCDDCTRARARMMDRLFEQAGENEECMECGHYYPPYNVTDDVEDVAL